MAVFQPINLLAGPWQLALWWDGHRVVRRFDIPEALAHARGWAAARGIRRVPRGTRSSTQQPSSPHPNQPPPAGRYTRERERERSAARKDEPQPREDFVVQATLRGMHHLLLLHCPAGEGVQPIASPPPAARCQLLPLGRCLSCQRHGSGTQGRLHLPQAPDGEVSSAWRERAHCTLG